MALQTHTRWRFEGNKKAFLLKVWYFTGCNATCKNQAFDLSFLYFYTISPWKTTNYFKETSSKTVKLLNASLKMKMGTLSLSSIVTNVQNWWKLEVTGTNSLMKIQERLVAGLQAAQLQNNWLTISVMSGGIYQLWTCKSLRMSTFTQELTDFTRVLTLWGLLCNLQLSRLWPCIFILLLTWKWTKKSKFLNFRTFFVCLRTLQKIGTVWRMMMTQLLFLRVTLTIL